MGTLSWDDDYELSDEDGGMYLYVGNHCIVINHGSDYTSIDIYERDAEKFIDSEPLASAYADHEGNDDE